MSIMDILAHFIGNIFVITFSVIAWLKLSNIKKNKGIMILIIILLSILLTIISFLFPNPIKLLITFLMLIAGNYFSINQQIKFSIISVTITQIILAFAEFSGVIVCSIFLQNELQYLLLELIPYILLNLYVAVISYFIFSRKFILNLFHVLYNNTKGFENIIYPLIIILTLIITTIESYMKISLTLTLITNLTMAIIFISIVITSQKLKINYNKISNKYETSISSLKEYEVMIDKFRVETHENKNEFLTVRNMIKDNPDEAIKYIDKLVDNKIEDNNKIMKKTAKIPSGGLKATIYSKLCLMDKLKIKYKLNIARDVHTTDLINLDEDLVLKICKILGVFLDNAIEAVKKLKKKEIFVEIYSMDDNLCIDITNNFKGNLDLNKISEQKYTTKGEGHGYGLSLVDKLLKEEPERLENEKSINRDTFTQMLKIKM